MAETLRTILELISRGGTTTRREFEEAAKGPDALRAAFDKADESFKKVPRTLRAVDAAAQQTRGNLEATAGRLGVIGEAANAIGPIGTIAAAAAVGIGAGAIALHNMARGAADAAGELVDLEDLTGVSTATLQAYRIAAAGAGVDQEAFNKAIQTFTKNAGDAELGTGKLSGKLKALDPDFLKLVNNAATVEEKFDLVVTKINELPPGAERAAVATAAFGAEGAKIANVGESVAEVTDRYRDLNAIIGNDTLRAAESAGDALDEQTGILRQQILVLETEAAPAILGFEAQWVRGANVIVGKLSEILVDIGLINQSVDKSSRDLTTRRAALSSELADLNRDAGRGLDTGASAARRADIEAEIAAIERWQGKIRDRQKTSQAATDADARDLKRRHELARGELAEIREQEKHQAKIDADRKKSASEAEAAAKRRTEAHARALETIADLEQKASVAGLEGVEKLEAEREVAYEKFAELVEDANLTQEEAASGYLAIWVDADRKITAEREKEDEKRAAAAEREAERQAQIAERLAEQEADALRRPLEDTADAIGDVLGGALTDFVRGGKVELDELWEGFVDAGLNAFADLAAEQLSLNIVAAVTGQQQPGQLINLFGTGPGGSGAGVFNRLTSGISDLASGIFGLSDATLANTGAVTDLTNAVPFTGDNAGGGFTGAVDPGASQFPDVSGTAGVVSQGGAALGGAAMGGIILGILGAALGTVGAIDSLRRGRRFASSQEDVVDLLNKGAIANDPTGLARIVGADRATRGTLEDNPSAVDRSIAAVLTIGTSELVRLAGLTPQPPTGGTVGRANFEKRVEGVTDFFENDFDRSIGQDFAHDFVDAGLGEFREGLLTAGAEFRDIIGLSAIQDLVLKAAGGVARADLGDEIGSEPQRWAALYTTLVGNLAEKGADAVTSLTAAKQVLDSFGSAPKVYDLTGDFFESDDNDIPLEDQEDIARGLAVAYFSDLIPAQTAARIGLEEFRATGKLVYADVKKEVEAAAAEFQILAPLLTELAQGVAADPDAFFVNGLVGEQTLTTFKDAVAEAMRDAVIQGFIAGTLESTFNPLFAPIFADQQQIIKDLNEGEISPEEASAALAGVGERFADSLDRLDPVIRQTVENVALISRAFGLAGEEAEDSAADIAKAFDFDINRQLLGLLDPQAAELFDADVAARERLRAARESGADLGKVERLNGLIRQRILEKAGEDEARELERQAAERQRAIEDIARIQDGIHETILGFTAAPTSPLAPATAFGNAQREFDRLFNRALGGDRDALERIAGAGEDLIAIGQQRFGSTEEFFRDVLDPTLAKLEQLEDLDPATFLTAGDQGIIDAVEGGTAIQQEIADLLAELYAALTLDEHGHEDADTGTREGDHIVRGVPGGDVPRDDGIRGNDGTRAPTDNRTSAGRFNLSSADQRNLQGVLAGATRGGDIEQEILAMLEADRGFDESEYGRLLRAMFAGARSKDGQGDVLEAILGKIEDPAKFQPVLGFRDEGSFEVRGRGGFDRVPVSFNATAGEHVYVTTGNLTRMMRDLGDAIVAGDAREQSLLRSLTRSVESLDRRMARVESIADQRQHQPKVTT